MSRDENNIVFTIGDMVESLGFNLWGCQIKCNILSVYIDSDRGVGIDDCSRIHRQLQPLLIVENMIGTKSLAVSSPGLNRPLFHLHHFSRFINYEINITLKNSVDVKKKRIKGKIKSVSKEDLKLKIDEKEEMVFNFISISRANLSLNNYTF